MVAVVTVHSGATVAVGGGGADPTGLTVTLPVDVHPTVFCTVIV